jgi:D-mannonate dehydratase
VHGAAERLLECFPGEGKLDLTAVIRALKDAGSTGCVIADHAPHTVGDDRWTAKSRAYQTGCIRGMLRAVTDLT